jgi:proline racemase
MGIARALVRCEGKRIAGVTINMIPSFFKDQLRFEVPDIGTLVADIAYGGNYFYAQIDSKQKGWKLAPENAQQLIDVGLKIRETINRITTIRHPEYPWVRGVSAVEFHGPAEQPGAKLRNVHVYGTGQIDRSPCGSGMAAKMAVLYAQGRLKLGEVYVQESILGTTFTGRVIEETKVAGYCAVLKEITGRAFITGLNQIVLDNEDPLDKGFLLGISPAHK